MLLASFTRWLHLINPSSSHLFVYHEKILDHWGFVLQPCVLLFVCFFVFFGFFVKQFNFTLIAPLSEHQLI